LAGRTGLVLSLGDRDHLLRPWVPPGVYLCFGPYTGATRSPHHPLVAPTRDNFYRVCRVYRAVEYAAGRSRRSLARSE
jgi:hypothetical protein